MHPGHAPHTWTFCISVARHWRELSNGGTQTLHMQKRKVWLLQAHCLKHFCVDPLHPCRIKIFEDLNKNIIYLFFQLWCHKLERTIFLEKKLTSLYTENCSGNLFRMAASEAELKQFRLRCKFGLPQKKITCHAISPQPNNGQRKPKIFDKGSFTNQSRSDPLKLVNHCT